MATPALFWWHMSQNLKKQDGVKRAKAALSSTAVGKLKSDSDGATLISQDFIATIKCLPQDSDSILTIIIVAGNDGKETKGVMEGLRTGMQKGIFD
jgi:hypothetical protein